MSDIKEDIKRLQADIHQKMELLQSWVNIVAKDNFPFKIGDEVKDANHLSRIDEITGYTIGQYPDIQIRWRAHVVVSDGSEYFYTQAQFEKNLKRKG